MRNRIDPLRLSHVASLGDTYGHRADRVVEASRSDRSAVLPALIDAFAAEPDPAMRKLLALAVIRVAGRLGRALDPELEAGLEKSVSWTLPH